MPELSLWLDSYDDIFSDFDSRHYHKRRVSEDFIEELRETLKYKTERFNELVLLLPAGLRKKENETEIAASIHDQFRNRFDSLHKKEKRVYKRGIVFVTAGILLMAIDSYITFLGYKAFPVMVMRIIIEPAGWFLMWNGLDLLLYNFRKAKTETEFYRIISEFKIQFKDS